MTTTAKQRANLLRLARYLETLPEDYEHFSMNEFLVFRNRRSPHANVVGTEERTRVFKNPTLADECGAVACAVGHGPNAGIPFEYNASWLEYAEQAFGLKSSTKEWLWCFSGNWASSDNTPQGAAKRIKWYLANGVPENSAEQKVGSAPLCYR